MPESIYSGKYDKLVPSKELEIWCKIKYLGLSGKLVYEKFDTEINHVFKKIIRKHKLSMVSCWIVDFPEIGGRCLQQYIEVNAGSFFNKGHSLDLGIAILVHELGHCKFWHNCKKSEANIPLKDEALIQIFNQTKQSGIMYTFNDYHFTGYGGHVQDNENEFYASSFMISELYLKKYKIIFYNAFDIEQKDLAEKIFEIVQKPLS
ncbi:hypothetical protein HYV79_02950 [Candidatus Woesearchaeota archaeon]|nr:hypothetical protein [Candidatus Woesearchaeota archaeon]